MSSVNQKEDVMSGESPVMTVEQCALLMRISRGSAYSAIRANQIPHLRIGKRILIPRAKLMAMLGETGPVPTDARIVEA